ncbi:MAG: CaiB/BaiF CoA-transferase family protein [Verrucomicrobiota bacterium JB024]|nr:CaiB/BaiF CoA-transferase family protein [Verrucomicrobiota bacterium JB024]
MPQALDGLKVLDFTQLLQGPYATQMLGDLGADVIKIEKPGSGDIYRKLTFFNEWIGGDESLCFLPWNRNKRSLALDLKSSEAADVIQRLAREADIVVENFRPGVMDRLGYGYEALHKLNPRLIYCSATGWGPDGPYRDRPGQDLLVQGLAGVVMASGQRSHGPVAVGTALSDQLGALHIVYSVLAALYYREKTGHGQRIEVNLLQSVLAYCMQDFFTVHNGGRSFERPDSGIAHPGNGAPFGIYRTADGYLSIAMNPWSKVVEALGEPDLLRYDDPQVLFDQRDEVFHAIEAVTVTRTTADWLDIMLALDLWVAPVNEQKDVADDPQVRHLHAFREIEHPKAGRLHVTDIPFRMSETPGDIRRPPPLIGEHSREILEECGLSPEQIDALYEKGTVTTEALTPSPSQP